MASKILFGGSLVLLAGVAGAQETATALRVNQAPKDAGVYNFATGTWTRSGGSAVQGGAQQKILYNNTAPSGFYGVSGAAEDMNWTDEGRLPSCSGHANAKSDSYSVNGFQIAYCAGGVAGPINFGIDFYDCYAACSDPRTQTAVASFVATIPGFVPGTNTANCWIVTFNLLGTSLEFKLEGDCDNNFDGTSSIDNFGWTLHLNNGLTSNLMGPILSGDPAGQFGCAAPAGDGTYYQAGACTSPYGFNFGTGLGYNDRFHGWSPQPTSPNGCFWFGGYVNGAPMGQFWLIVYGDNQGSSCGLGTPYCTGNPNSVGPGGSLTMSGSGDVSNADTVATATGVPNQPGVFYLARNPIAVPFGCGFLCAGVGTVRGNVVTGVSGNTATYAYNESGPKRSLASFVGFGSARCQYWYRDPMNSANCGNTFNLSNAVHFPVVP